MNSIQEAKNSNKLKLASHPKRAFNLSNYNTQIYLENKNKEQNEKQHFNLINYAIKNYLTLRINSSYSSKLQHFVIVKDTT